MYSFLNFFNARTAEMSDSKFGTDGFCGLDNIMFDDTESIDQHLQNSDPPLGRNSQDEIKLLNIFSNLYITICLYPMVE